MLDGLWVANIQKKKERISSLLLCLVSENRSGYLMLHGLVGIRLKDFSLTIFFYVLSTIVEILWSLCSESKITDSLILLLGLKVK